MGTHPIFESDFDCLTVMGLFWVALISLAGLVRAQDADESVYDFWFFRLLMNLLGYASLIVPAYFYKRYLDSKNYKVNGSNQMIINFFYGKDVAPEGDLENLIKKDDVATPKEEKTILQTALRLCFCASGLYTSYLTWGVLQERIITREYGVDENGVGEKFTDSQFLVFINRFSALVVAGIYIQVKRQQKHGCPFYKYSFCSFSNILSSWFQYEALKFVSFPTQVLAKACKVIPVMLMGKAISGNKYPWFDWFTAGLLGVGTSIFLLSNSEDKSGDAVQTTFSGLICLAGYMAFDSFTSNWQSEVFKYKMSSMEMMFGVNVFSCLFTSWSLIQQGTLSTAMAFVFNHPDFMWHAFILSAASCSGQLFIYYTIAEFGAVVFTIIMTTRSALAIILSCIIYSHPVNALGVFGILVAFSSLGLRIWYKIQQKKKKQAEANKA